MSHAIVNCQWLNAHLDDADLIILDAFMLNVVGKKLIEYDELIAIPGALPLDIEMQFCDQESTQLHALPTQAQFTKQAQKLGINQQSQIVIYDNQGIYSAPRAWWTFKVMGFDNVKVLDGGLPAWIEQGYVTTPSYGRAVERGNIVGTYRDELVCDYQTVLDRLTLPSYCLIDARGSARFNGEVAEPRPGVRSGRIPNSVNLPFSSLMQGHTFKPAAQLHKIFSDIGAIKDSDLIFSCGSGITACILLLAAHEVGLTNSKLYDGSWAQWGSRTDLPLG
ncbi:3-mercaptopyruvate sulfurtransferase [Vibrio sp. UCD-FRSSP16_10]|uniref:sulfurtransferase n=1 Tax=unclassified Vibrio TaxID=2614977 RepID=UPI0007FCEA7D|nr:MULTISPECIES: sulfurtransferase [unclassified Vibrio]OBT12109.1 3-mercaptopyruvate sulfurtransferase [Vibrio sp. UCD-FRSSP16_30]OBT20440.1 3-mercaptopyruvate sulfurtransferase [Vibrio sp. UCD-FRSSP16_10]